MNEYNCPKCECLLEKDTEDAALYCPSCDCKFYLDEDINLPGEETTE